MKQGTTLVGMDAHRAAINLAVLLPGETKPLEWQLANEAAAVRRMVRKIQRQLDGTRGLLAQLIYGGGLRVMEACQLRVKDFDFEQGLIFVRASNGDKELPGALAAKYPSAGCEWSCSGTPARAPLRGGA